MRAAAIDAGLWGAKESAELPTGCIVAVAFLDADLPTTGDEAPKIDRTERAWGNWSDGRRAFRFSDVFALKSPASVRGGQRFYKLADDVLADIAASELIRIR